MRAQCLGQQIRQADQRRRQRVGHQVKTIVLEAGRLLHSEFGDYAMQLARYVRQPFPDPPGLESDT